MVQQAKHDTVKWYADMKTTLLTDKRFERMCTDTNLLLAHHMRQAHYTWRQQEQLYQAIMEIWNGRKIPVA